ncbi:unnamed protein product [Rodentolepis nana]|uniref:Translation initiation factor eIF2B subunit beta n=1 Tax=Rodentolepis nana TaxID=102285 RepID=A0A0R3T4M7_RODNA|nr:unnamed protein product [Rodentolepis nana]
MRVLDNCSIDIHINKCATVNDEAQNPTTVALNTLGYLKQVILSENWKDAAQLLSLLKRTGKILLANSFENVPTHNTIQRIIKIVKDVIANINPRSISSQKQHQLMVTVDEGEVDLSFIAREELIDGVMEGFNDLDDDIKSQHGSIACSSLNFIHSDELILTVGYSKLVLDFLKYAASKNRQFRVIVCEGFPDNGGHKMANELASDDISVILAPDSHVFALMARVNKVILSCYAVYPDGALKAPTGSEAIMLAAQSFTVPIYVCLPSILISPLNLQMLPGCSNALNVHAECYPGSLKDSRGIVDLSLNGLESTYKMLPPSVSRKCCTGPPPQVHVPTWDYIKPGLTTLFLTSDNGAAPSYLYALVRDLFSLPETNESLTWFEDYDTEESTPSHFTITASEANT